MSRDIQTPEERQAEALEKLADIVQMYLVGALDLAMASTQRVFPGGPDSADPIGDLIRSIGDLREGIARR